MNNNKLQHAHRVVMNTEGLESTKEMLLRLATDTAKTNSCNYNQKKLIGLKMSLVI